MLPYDVADKNFEEIKRLYDEKGRGAVAEFLGIRYNSVGHILKYLGLYVDKVRHSQAIRDREKAKNPFLQDTWEKFYLIGYILGDGSITEKHPGLYNLNISSKDLQNLRKIGECFGRPVGGPWKECYSVDVNDQGVCRWLMAYGIKQRKSKNGCFISIPQDWWDAFLLGLLDSDGCVRHQRGRLALEWFGHPSYMETVKDYVGMGTINYRKDGLVCVAVRGREAEEIRDWIYRRATLGIERKKERAYESC